MNVSNQKTTAMTPFQPTSMEQAYGVAEQFARSALMPQALRNKPDDVFVVLCTGQELGLSPMQAIRGMHVIQGRAVMSADLMVGLTVKRTDVCEYFRLVESTPNVATYETKRAGSPDPVRLSFTLDDAKRANLLGKDNWKAYPAAMLRARCASGLVRAVYPDLMLGVYDHDEMDSEERRPTPVAPRPRAAEPAVIDVEAVPILPTPRMTVEIDTTPANDQDPNETRPEVPENVPPPKANHRSIMLERIRGEVERLGGLGPENKAKRAKVVRDATGGPWKAVEAMHDAALQGLFDLLRQADHEADELPKWAGGDAEAREQTAAEAALSGEPGSEG